MAEVRLISKFSIPLPTFSEKEDDDTGMQKTEKLQKPVQRFSYLPPNQSLDAQLWKKKKTASLRANLDLLRKPSEAREFLEHFSNQSWANLQDLHENTCYLT